MTDKDKMELVSAAIDGELDIDEQRELDALLASSPEAQSLKSDLEQMDSVLKGVPALDPPASLFTQIMAETRPTAVPGKTSVIDWLRQLVPGAGLRYALAASAGALVAAIIITADEPQSGPIDVADLVGTMAPGTGTDASNVLANFAYQADDIESTVQLRAIDSDLYLDIRTKSKAPLDIDINLGGVELSPLAMTQVEGQHRSVRIAGQNLKFQTEGTQHTTILLRRANATSLAGKADITIDLSSNGRLLQQGVLQATW